MGFGLIIATPSRYKSTHVMHDEEGRQIDDLGLVRCGIIACQPAGIL